MVQWHVVFPEPERNFRFSAAQYRNAIYEGLNAADRTITGKGYIPIGPYDFTRKKLKECLCQAALTCRPT